MELTGSYKQNPGQEKKTYNGKLGSNKSQYTKIKVWKVNQFFKTENELI